MRILWSLALAAWAIAATACGASAAGAPYPASTTITGLAWDKSSYRSGGEGGDIWSVTSASSDRVVTAWGDAATAGCGREVSYGVALLTGGPNTNPMATACGPLGDGKGKLTSLLSVGNTLYAIVNLQNRPWPDPDFAVWASTDLGKTWARPAWRFAEGPRSLRPMNFVNFGPAYTSTRDDYVYITAEPFAPDARQRDVYLMRAPKGELLRQAAYQYLSGIDASGQATWGDTPETAEAVFTDPNGVDGPEIVRDEGLGRYLLTVAHSGGGVGVFESEEVWGPWRTVSYVDAWLGIRGGEYLGVHLPVAWMADGGRTLWAVFSCYGRSTCGIYHDRLNLMRADLTTADEAGGGTGEGDEGGGTTSGGSSGDGGTSSSGTGGASTGGGTETGTGGETTDGSTTTGSGGYYTTSSSGGSSGSSTTTGSSASGSAATTSSGSVSSSSTASSGDTSGGGTPAYFVAALPRAAATPPGPAVMCQAGEIARPDGSCGSLATTSETADQPDTPPSRATDAKASRASTGATERRSRRAINCPAGQRPDGAGGCLIPLGRTVPLEQATPPEDDVAADVGAAVGMTVRVR